MGHESRHQCLIYEGAPSGSLSALAAVIRDKLNANHRCLYLNSPTMVAGMRSYLAAAGVDVQSCIAKGSLVLSSALDHLVDGSFHCEQMMRKLDDAVKQSLNDGYQGLWATGDMSWEFGPDKDFKKLLEYEMNLEKYFREQPCLSGICQYHVDALPREAVQQATLTHQSFFINNTLSRLNPDYLPPERVQELL